MRVVTERYRAHGLLIDSEFDLPYDRLARADGPPEVTISAGTGTTPDPMALDVGALCHATPDRCWVHVPGVAHYEIAHGTTVTVSASPGADPLAVTAFLTSSAIGAVIHQRRGLLLEAAVVARDGSACAIVAQAGAGQSTLASSLAWSGLTFVGDDLAHLTIDDEQTVHAGTHQARLWPDTLVHAGLDPADFEKVQDGIGKRRVPLRSGHLRTDQLTLRGCLLVDTHEINAVETAELSGRERFTVLSNHTWRRRLVTAGGYRNEHFAQLTALAAAIPVTRITRPRDRVFIDETRDAALEVIEPWLI